MNYDYSIRASIKRGNKLEGIVLQSMKAGTHNTVDMNTFKQMVENNKVNSIKLGKGKFELDLEPLKELVYSGLAAMEIESMRKMINMSFSDLLDTKPVFRAEDTDLIRHGWIAGTISTAVKNNNITYTGMSLLGSASKLIQLGNQVGPIFLRCMAKEDTFYRMRLDYNDFNNAMKYINMPIQISTNRINCNEDLLDYYRILRNNCEIDKEYEKHVINSVNRLNRGMKKKFSN